MKAGRKGRQTTIINKTKMLVIKIIFRGGVMVIKLGFFKHRGEKRLLGVENERGVKVGSSGRGRH